MTVNCRLQILTVLRKLGLIGLITQVVNLSLSLVKWSCHRVGLNHLDIIYNRRYFKSQDHMTQPTAGQVVECLIETFNPNSVIDVGCGTGVYIYEFEKRNVRAIGIDGSRHAIAQAKVPSDKIQRADLTQPLPSFFISSKCNLVICFEVAEHLLARDAGTLIDNLSGMGDNLVFSAAAPGQGGLDHINEQPPEYWITLCESKGWKYNEELTETLRYKFKQCNVAWWLAKNTIIFQRHL